MPRSVALRVGRGAFKNDTIRAVSRLPLGHNAASIESTSCRLFRDKRPRTAASCSSVFPNTQAMARSEGCLISLAKWTTIFFFPLIITFPRVFVLGFFPITITSPWIRFLRNSSTQSSTMFRNLISSLVLSLQSDGDERANDAPSIPSRSHSKKI